MKRSSVKRSPVKRSPVCETEKVLDGSALEGDDGTEEIVKVDTICTWCHKFPVTPEYEKEQLCAICTKR